MKNVLVTGAGGYLGGILVRNLLDQTFKVTAVDTFEHGPSLAALAYQKNLSIVRGDLTDNRTLRPLLASGWDAVVHLAAIVGADACNAQYGLAFEVNEGISTVLAEGLPDDTLLVYPCTNSGYGIGSDAACTEESPLNPLSHYGRTKVNAERVIMNRENSISLRLATLFGWAPRMRRDLLVNDMVWRACRDHSVMLFEGGFRRNFCHVRDASSAFLHAIRNGPKMKGQIYNVGDWRANMTKLQLCEKIQDHLPRFRFIAADHASDPDKRDYVVSNAKIEETGWCPTYSLDDGIEELIKGYAMLRREQYGNA